jgi:hypothetical protein
MHLPLETRVHPFRVLTVTAERSHREDGREYRDKDSDVSSCIHGISGCL